MFISFVDKFSENLPMGGVKTSFLNSFNQGQYSYIVEK
jgi:hypothetical protein